MGGKPIISVLTPARETVPLQFMGSYNAMIAELAQGFDVRNHLTTKMPLDAARNDLWQKARAAHADYALWVDSDMVIPGGAASRLIRSGLDLVSGLYFMRAPPYLPVARVLNENGKGHRFLTEYPPDEPIRINGATGMGFLLCSRKVLDALPGKPFFFGEWSEDLNFFEACRKAGFELWLDTGCKLGHIGGISDESLYLAMKGRMKFEETAEGIRYRM